MINDEEVWLPVLGLEGEYEVSSHGRVRSVSRVMLHRNGRLHNFRGRIKTLNLAKKEGYHRVSVRDGENRWVHSLVAEAFHGSRPEGMVVRHLDGNKLNNRADNLRWGTPSENMLDRVTHGTHNHAIKESCPWGHLLSHPNLAGAVARTGRGRACRACHQARSTVTYWSSRGVELDQRAVADEKYARLMGAPVAQVASSASDLLAAQEKAERASTMPLFQAVALVHEHGERAADREVVIATRVVLAQLARLGRAAS